MKKIAFYHGRFQPFHYGHLKVIKTALSMCNLLVIGISNPFRLPPTINYEMDMEGKDSLLQARDISNNPWPYWARILMIRNGLKTEGVDLNSVLFIPNLNNSGVPINEIHMPKEIIKIFICPKQSHNKAKMEDYLNDGWDVHVIEPEKNMFGSGIIREKIKKGEEWESFVPKGTATIIKILSNNNTEELLNYV